MFLTVLVCNVWIIYSTEKKIFSSIDGLPARNVALILGTSKYSKEGRPNPYFHYRIEAAVNLHNHRKIKHIIVSGDNSLPYYNEPMDMKKALIKKGIPDSIITLDYAGFRTFDSVVRSKKVFNQNSIIIVTQKFHLYRALFISDNYQMDAVGFEANKAHDILGTETMTREIMARFLAVLDIYVLKKTPKFLGKQENISL